MSNVYLIEPPTSGKVVLHTTIGDIEIDLWSKECSKTARNFVQLCLEGYYDGCIFHRVVKDFLAQTGDPTGTGTGILIPRRTFWIPSVRRGIDLSSSCVFCGRLLVCRWRVDIRSPVRVRVSLAPSLCAPRHGRHGPHRGRQQCISILYHV
jgi:hypothetical protein